MSMTGLLIAIAIIGGTGLLFGTLIALAHRKLWVYEDPRIDQVAAMLPGVNCGACGYPGCRGFAEAAVHGDIAPAKCTVMNNDMRADVAAYLGVEAGQAEKRVARLLCAGGSDVSRQRADYIGIESCAAAIAAGGGGKGCVWGCVGLADCAIACTFDAIHMNDYGLPVVDVDKCTACNDCVVACPLQLFTILPLDSKLIVQCKNLLSGDDATDVCAVACNACGRCVADAAPGLITMQSGLAVIDYSKISMANPAATARCPTNAIAWVDGAQFTRQLIEA
ncbi:MAG TPA: RnfABCDGE type electron transport complex subunit B [Longimicrobiales bacterium]